MSRITSIILTRIATPLTVGLFLVCAVSGVAVFFGIGSQYFYDMHAWLSLLLLLPVGFHIWRNWASFLVYVQRSWLWPPAAISLVLALAFVARALSWEGGGDPGVLAYNLLMDSKLSAIAPLVHEPAQELARALREQGFTVGSSDSTLAQIATASGRDPAWVMSSVAVMGRR